MDAPVPPTPGSDAAVPRSPATGPASGPAASGLTGQPVDASLYLHPQTLARLGSMDLRAKMIVEGVMSGAHRSPFQGFSVEFAQHRPYTPGDDLRHLDWKVYGRTDRLQVKQYQQETNLDLVVMVDGSGSMNYGTRRFAEASGAGRKTSPDGRGYWSKYDHATALAAAISYITLRQGDRAGLVVFADDVRAQVKRSSSQGTWRQIVEALGAQPVDRPTDLARTIDQVLGTITNRCLIVLVSDLFEEPERLRAALARVRHRRHDLIAFQVTDRSETEFDFRDSAPFEGLEGEGRMRIDPRAVREAYLKAFNEHTDEVERIIRGYGFGCHRLSTHEWLGPALATFLARRNAEMKRKSFG